MRLSPRAIFPAAMSAVLLLITLQTASAVDIQATPVIEPETTSETSASSLSPLQVTGEPSISYDHSESVHTLPNAQYFFTFDWDISGVDFGTIDNNVTLRFTLSYQDTDGGSFTSRWLGEHGESGSVTFSSGQIRNQAMYRNCVHHEGHIKAELLFDVYNNQTLEGLYEAIPYPIDIPCSADIIPAPPDDPAEVCGPNNDTIVIPDQPNGVLVNDTGWVDGERTVEYDNADWAIFPTDFDRTYSYDDNDECEPDISYDHPDSLGTLPGADFYYTISWDVSHVDFGVDDDDVTFSFELSYPVTGGVELTHRHLSVYGDTGSVSFTRGQFNGPTIQRNCVHNEGRINAQLNFHASNRATNERLYTAETYVVDIRCSAEVSPVAPGEAFEVCGPGNDLIDIPDQPNGVIVSDTQWENGERTITYDNAEWAVFPEGFATTYSFTDDQPCDAEAEITGPDTLYLLESGSQMEITGTYDVSSMWPQEGSLGARIEGSFETQRIGAYFGMPLPITSSADSFSITTQIPSEWLVEYCPDPEYAGDLEVFFDIIFYQQTGPTTYETVWTYEQTLDIPCTVAVTPLDATVNDDVCGYVDERIIVPQQRGISGHSISWADNVATITYQPATAYEIVGGPYTVTVTGDPCIVTPIPPADPVAVCGPNNDILTIPTQPEGVTIEDSGWVDNERTLAFIAEGGYAFPENTPRSVTTTDENIPCEEDPIGTTLVVKFETSDSGSIAGTPYQLYAPEASQVSQAPYVEGEIDAGNQIVLEEMIAGTYRLVTAPEGYEPIDVTIEVIADDASEEHLIAVAATQPVETPAPSPEPTIEPTVEPTAEVTQTPVDPTATAEVPQIPADPTPTATQESDPVTGLPETGSGSGNGFGAIALAGLLAAMMLGFIGRRRSA